MQSAGRLLLLVVVIWIAIEFSTNGIDGAFGGLLANGAESTRDRVEEGTARVPRAADAFQRAYDESTNRVDRMLEEPQELH